MEDDSGQHAGGEGQDGQDDPNPEVNGPDAVRAMAEGYEQTPEVVRTAEDYFLGRVTPPESTFLVEVDFGTIDAPAPVPVTFKSVGAEVFEAGERYAERKSGLGRTIELDTFKQASYTFCAAIVEPRLGPIVEQRNRNGGKFPDAPALVRDVFKERPGVVFRVHALVRKHSRLGEDDEGAAREVTQSEVEAGKTSS